MTRFAIAVTRLAFATLTRLVFTTLTWLALTLARLALTARLAGAA
jgi:hypothetical protein